MRSSHALARVKTTVDEDNLHPKAWLQIPAALAQEIDIDEQVTLPKGVAGRANCGSKATTVICITLVWLEAPDL